MSAGPGQSSRGGVEKRERERERERRSREERMLGEGSTLSLFHFSLKPHCVQGALSCPVPYCREIAESNYCFSFF